MARDATVERVRFDVIAVERAPPSATCAAAFCVTLSSPSCTHPRASRRYSVERMIARARSFWLTGVEARRIDVEADVQRGAARRSPSSAWPTARCRRRASACAAASPRRELRVPGERLTVNLAPAQERKQGSGFDLAIALAVLAASGQVEPPERVARSARPPSWAWTAGCGRCRARWRWPRRPAGTELEGLLVAPENAAEAALAERCRCCPPTTCTRRWRSWRGRADPGSGARRQPPAGSRPRPGRRARPARAAAGARDRRRRRPQPADGGAARLRQDDAGPAAAGHPAAADACPSARDHAHPVRGGTLNGHGRALGRPFRAPHHSASAGRAGRRQRCCARAR